MSAGLGVLVLHLWERGQDYLEIEALWRKLACCLVQAHRASNLMKKPCISGDFPAILVGTSFSRERYLVRIREKLAVNRL